MRRGFTLIELLIVIAIIAILVGIGVVGYLSSRQKAELDLAHDRIVSTLRVAQEEVRQGLGNSVCRGVLFQNGAVPIAVVAPFVHGKCVRAPQEQHLLPFPSSLVILSIIEQKPLDVLEVWYLPPDGRMDTSQRAEEFVVTIGFPNKDPKLFTKRIRIQPFTGAVHTL